MPEIDFQIVGVEAGARGLVPLLHFRVRVSNVDPLESVHSILLTAQIQIQSPRREYSAVEKDRLRDLFGTPDRWGQTLRSILWTHAQTTVRPFHGSTEAILPVPCTYDLNITAAKYFYAIENGEVPLLFLFSGTVFYATESGALQAAQLSWQKESSYRLPASVWKALMDEHFPNSAWVTLHRDVFDRLYAYKRTHGLATWDQTLERLLPVPEQPETQP